MDPKVIAVGKIKSMHDKGDRISCVLEITPQEGFVENLANDNPYLENFQLRGDFKFGTRYEILIREAAQQNLPLEGRVFREEEEETIIVPASSPIFKRPSKKSWVDEPSDYDNDTDINI